MSKKKVTNAEIFKITDRKQFRNKLSKTSPDFFYFILEWFFPLIDGGKLYCIYLLIQHWFCLVFLQSMLILFVTIFFLSFAETLKSAHPSKQLVWHKTSSVHV